MTNQRFVSFVFIIIITIFPILTTIYGYRNIGNKTFISYRDKLPDNHSFYDNVKGMINGFETGINDVVFLKGPIINLYGYIQKLINKKVINDISELNTVYKLDNGQLTFLSIYNQVNGFYTKTIKFKSFLENFSIPLLYIQAPYKTNKYNNQLPYNIEDSPNIMADEYLKKIKKSNISLIDLREEIHNSNLDYKEIFFNTDHHWKPETGLWASKLIANEISYRYNFSINPDRLNKNNYKTVTLKQFFLGSQGKRVGINYSGIDDFSIITPKFKTEYVLINTQKNSIRKGDYKSTLLFDENLSSKDKFSSFSYSYYLGNDSALLILKNLKAPNQKKILLLRDSFSAVIAPFLIETCSQIDIIDLRTYKEKTIVNYVKESKPDLVIMLYNPSVFARHAELYEKQFDFF